MPWLQLHIATDKAEEQRLEQALEQLGALSLTLADAGDEPIVELGPGETRLWQQLRLTALFEADVQAEAICQALVEQIGPDLEARLSFERLADQPWERAWLEHFQPMRFGRRLWICPSGQVIDDPQALVIQLDPGLAFGTGTHPTTALCLEWLEQDRLEGLEVLDFGCGSGILSIAALKLGAAQVHALDHDPQAIRASEDNARNNGVFPGLRLYPPGSQPQQAFDRVLANILSGTLMQLAPRLTQLTRPGGILLMSGVLEEQAEEVLAAYRQDFDLDVADRREGWVLIRGHRHPC